MVFGIGKGDKKNSKKEKEKAQEIDNFASIVGREPEKTVPLKKLPSLNDIRGSDVKSAPSNNRESVQKPTLKNRESMNLPSTTRDTEQTTRDTEIESPGLKINASLSGPPSNSGSIIGGEPEDYLLASNRSSILYTEESKGGDPQVKFKMMMIGDLSAGKSDMMAKYFGRSPHEIFMSLTEQGINRENKVIECIGKLIKIDALDTTQSSNTPDMFQHLIKTQRGIVCAYNPFKKSSWDYLKTELKPILDGEYGERSSKYIVIGNHMIKGHSEREPDVSEKEVMEYCYENGIFYIKINGENNKGLKEAFEFGPCSYMMKKENNIEALILKKMQQTNEWQQQRYKRYGDRHKKEVEKFSGVIQTLKDRNKERDLVILTAQEELVLVKEQLAKVEAENETIKADMLKLQMSKTGIIAPKTSVQKITSRLNINDDEFKKTLNIIDHWIKLPSPQKSIQTNIICNMLQNPKKIEQIKLDIDRHEELPSLHIIQNLVEGTFATELNIDFDCKSKWFSNAQRITFLLWSDIMELHIFLVKTMMHERSLVTFKRLMVQMIQKFPNIDGTKVLNPTLQFQNKINKIMDILKTICTSKEEDKSKRFTPKDLDIAKQFEKLNPNFIDDTDFNEKFQLVIYEQLEEEIQHLEIVLEDHETFIRPEI